MEYFPGDEGDRLQELGLAAKAALRDDDRRVAEALDDALRMLDARLGAFTSAHEREDCLAEFEKKLGLTLHDALEDLLEACLYAAQYRRGLEAVDIASRRGLADAVHMIEHRAEFLAGMGRTEEAEAALLDELRKVPRDPWLYVGLGDVFFVDQPQEEHRDLARAEAWYWRGYDLGLADERTEPGRTLLERLGSVCIARLRRGAYARLETSLVSLGLGGAATMAQLREAVYLDGGSASLAAHLRTSCAAATDDPRQVLDFLSALDAAVRFMPQEGLDGRSAFEEAEFFPAGEQEKRIAAELGALEAEDDDPLSRGLAVKRFLEAKDPRSGVKRRTLIGRERAKTRRLYDRGRLVWKGFLRYRETEPGRAAQEPSFGRSARKTSRGQ